MPVKDQAKNREYVAKYRAMKKQNEEAKKEYNVLNASYVSKHREAKKAEKGLEEYKKEQAEYMRKYRASLKQTKLQTQTTASTTIQNAIRNKLARNALQNRKQELLNNTNDLKAKLNATEIANDFLNSLFPSVINALPETRQRVKLVARRLEPTEQKKRGRPVGSKNKPKN